MSDDIKALREQAKAKGINTFQMGKDAIQEALDAPAREDRPTTREAGGRRSRVPLGSMSQKLSFPPKPGYVRRWMNDAANRISDADGAGYTHVQERSDGRDVKVSRRVGTHEDGSPLTAHLMEIRQEFYEEDQAAKQAGVDEIDAAIKGGDPRGQDAEQDKFYTPAEGISMQVDNS